MLKYHKENWVYKHKTALPGLSVAIVQKSEQAASCLAPALQMLQWETPPWALPLYSHTTARTMLCIP